MQIATETPTCKSLLYKRFCDIGRNDRTNQRGPCRSVTCRALVSGVGKSATLEHQYTYDDHQYYHENDQSEYAQDYPQRSLPPYLLQESQDADFDDPFQPSEYNVHDALSGSTITYGPKQE